jgi:hypothetical protein
MLSGRAASQAAASSQKAATIQSGGQLCCRQDVRLKVRTGADALSETQQAE